MEPVSEWPIRRFADGRATPAADTIVTETRIELDVNDGRFRIAMLCLPTDLEALAVGFLLSEGALAEPGHLRDVRYEPAEQRVSVQGTFDTVVLENLRLRWTWGTGCGSGGTGRDPDGPPFASVGAGPTVSCGQLLALAEAFGARTDLWRRTGGVHACALAEADRLLLFAQDVGRHNAFDKVVGMAALGGVDPAGRIVLTTGRLSAEIVSKALACRVPILASRAAVTSLAVKLAGRYAQTLVGFLRGRRLNVYTGYQRVVAAEPDNRSPSV